MAVEYAVTTDAERLTRIAQAIKAELTTVADAQWRIGRLLAEARSLFTADRDFGHWFAVQGFGFSQATAYRLAEAADREVEVRAFIRSHRGRGIIMSGHRDILPTTAIKYMTQGAPERRSRHCRTCSCEAV